jgi:hypothetical protein
MAAIDEEIRECQEQLAVLRRLRELSFISLAAVVVLNRCSHIPEDCVSSIES